jgi:hypothetical protein
MLLFTLALIGCAHESGEQPDQLEASTASYGPGFEDEKGVSFLGEAFVEGGDRDWTVGVMVDAENEAVTELHLPGGSDLSVLHGTSLDIQLGSAFGGDDTRDVRIDDASGPRFLVQPSHEYGPASDLFGSDFASFGEKVGRGTMEDKYGTWKVAYYKAVFETDDGAVETDPGKPFVATIDGEDWRIVVHASFEVTDEPNQLPGCGGGISTTLSFEMLKVDATPPTEPLAPLAGARTAGHHDCGG